MGGSPSFDGIGQVELEIAGERALMPIFYYDSAAMTALFPAHYRQLRSDPRSERIAERNHRRANKQANVNER